MSIDSIGIPSTGWWIKLGPTTKESTIWHNGQKIEYCTRVVVEADASKPGLVTAQIDLVCYKANIHLSDKNVTVTETVFGESNKQLCFPEMI